MHMTEQSQSSQSYKLPDKSVVSREYLEKFPFAQKKVIDYLVKSGQITQDFADHLLRNRGEKTPEGYFEH